MWGFFYEENLPHLITAFILLVFLTPKTNTSNMFPVTFAGPLQKNKLKKSENKFGIMKLMLYLCTIK